MVGDISVYFYLERIFEFNLEKEKNIYLLKVFFCSFIGGFVLGIVDKCVVKYGLDKKFIGFIIVFVIGCEGIYIFVC